MSHDDYHASPPSRRRLFSHLTDQAGYAGALVVASLAIGMAGYHWIAGLMWIDAFHPGLPPRAAPIPLGDRPPAVAAARRAAP